ncbi:uncharacterized protein FRV6_06679 [Fusarium oxysporum]|uniref:Uncharacterized protein n=1 Tax=Fusarium oxysporum TaxID=5507 RepID=A0A2H3T1A4_FUSOX|nr:uncharacterized protein FRV6_06679 [Fusarium oxysporum]
MARHRHLHEHQHQHDADQPDTPAMRGRPRHSEDETPEGNDEQRTEATAVNIVDGLPRTGLVVFDDCRKNGTSKRYPAANLRRLGLTQIARACIIASNGFYVVNCDTSGPQFNICWRVPGPRNIWLARLAARQDGENSEHPPSMSPGMTLSCFQKGPSGDEGAWSIIMAKSGANVEERIGRGEGELAFGEPISEGGLVAFGRAVGIEGDAVVLSVMVKVMAAWN